MYNQPVYPREHSKQLRLIINDSSLKRILKKRKDEFYMSLKLHDWLVRENQDKQRLNRDEIDENHYESIVFTQCNQ